MILIQIEEFVVQFRNRNTAYNFIGVDVDEFALELVSVTVYCSGMREEHVNDTIATIDVFFVRHRIRCRTRS